MKKTVGFIGAGNMASAIIHGMINSKVFRNDEIMVYDTDSEKTKALKEKLKISVANDNEELLKSSEAVLIAVKPASLPKLLPGLSKTFEKEKNFVISIAAGQSIEKLTSLIGVQLPIVRVMPNINAVCSQAISGYAKNEFVTKENLCLAEKLLNCFGKAVQIDESLFSVFSAVAGCSPAYVYLFANTLSQASVKYGFTKKESLSFVCDEIINAVKDFEKDETKEKELENVVKLALKAAYEKDMKICM